MLTKQELSVLIPTYNYCCVELVRGLQAQAEALGISYEVLVADDGSTDPSTVAANEAIGGLAHCRYLVRPQNVGRAAIRNFLARTARYRYLLFIDSDMTLRDARFLERYLACEADEVIDGGISVGGDAGQLRHNLRYRYEKAAEAAHTASRRRQAPYQHLHTANLLVRRDIMLAHPFDERFRRYGYEDVLFGKAMKTAHISISHIDNPLGFDVFETNGQFVSKTEEGLRTLHEFRSELRGYSTLLTFVGNIHQPAVLWLVRLWHRLFGRLERRNLCGRRPCLRLFSLYKLGYYLTLK